MGWVGWTKGTEASLPEQTGRPSRKYQLTAEGGVEWVRLRVKVPGIGNRESDPRMCTWRSIRVPSA